VLHQKVTVPVVVCISSGHIGTAMQKALEEIIFDLNKIEWRFERKT
jgi:hypothetical protein